MTREERARFWRSWADGVLLLEVCAACGRRRLYTAPLCGACGSPMRRFEPASGTGEIYSYTTVPQRGRAERTVVLVTLTEGVRALGSLEGGAAARIGAAVRIAPDGTAAGPLLFTLTEAS